MGLTCVQLAARQVSQPALTHVSKPLRFVVTEQMQLLFTPRHWLLWTHKRWPDQVSEFCGKMKWCCRTLTCVNLQVSIFCLLRSDLCLSGYSGCKIGSITMEISGVLGYLCWVSPSTEPRRIIRAGLVSPQPETVWGHMSLYLTLLLIHSSIQIESNWAGLVSYFTYSIFFFKLWLHKQ